MRRYLFLFSSAVVTGCAVFDYAYRPTVILGLLLLLPLIDTRWSLPGIPVSFRNICLSWFGVIIVGVVLLLLNPKYIEGALFGLLLVAFSEEWFFRSYIMKNFEMVLGNKPGANVITSVFFVLLHLPTQGAFGLLVIFPSLFFGWVYQRTNDLILVVLTHAVFNIIFFIYIKDRI